MLEIEPELPNIVKDGQSFSSKWSKLSTQAEHRPNLPIYVSRNPEGEVSNHNVRARPDVKENLMLKKHQILKKQLLNTRFKYLKKLREVAGKMISEVFQTAIEGPEHTVTTTSRDRPMSVPYARHKDSKRNSKYQFTILENRKTKKMDRMARRGPLARPPGALKVGNVQNCQHFCRS